MMKKILDTFTAKTILHFFRLLSIPEMDVGEVKSENIESFDLMRCPQVLGNSSND